MSEPVQPGDARPSDARPSGARPSGARPSGARPSDARISTHVLDTMRGEPAAGVPIRLEREQEGAWVLVAAGHTDADGRVRDFAPSHAWAAGSYRLVFSVAAYLGEAAFFPEVTVTFRVHDPDRHHHVPLLLSPYGYTTYRGS